MIKSDKTDFNILFFKVQQIKDLGFSFLFALIFILIVLYTVLPCKSIGNITKSNTVYLFNLYTVIPCFVHIYYIFF